MKTGRGLFDYTPEEIDQIRKQRAEALRRGAQGDRGVGGSRDMRIRFLDSGSLVIDQAHITHGASCRPVRFPVYSC